MLVIPLIRYYRCFTIDPLYHYLVPTSLNQSLVMISRIDACFGLGSVIYRLLSIEMTLSMTLDAILSIDSTRRYRRFRRYPL